MRKTEIVPKDSRESSELTLVSIIKELIQFFSRWKVRFSVTFVVATLIIIMLCLPDSFQTAMFPITGGVLGTLGSSLVIFSFLCDKSMRVQPMPLVFWRAVADLLIGVRFLMNPLFNWFICKKFECTFFEHFEHETNCWFASAWLEFAELASECWFFCVAWDTFFSICDPFVSFKRRMRYYHMFAWGLPLIFGLFTGIFTHTSMYTELAPDGDYENVSCDADVPASSHNSVGGFWYIRTNHYDYNHDAAVNYNGDSVKSHTSYVDLNTFCWLRIYSTPCAKDEKYGTNDRLDRFTFIFLYVPLLLIYGVAFLLIINTIKTLKRGISATFLPRLRVMLINSLNISVGFLYWFFLISCYVLTTTIAMDESIQDKAMASVFNKLLQFTISSKGAGVFIVWCMMLNMKGVLTEGVDDSVDVNTALKKELLLYTSEGIRKCAKKAAENERELLTGSTSSKHSTSSKNSTSGKFPLSGKFRSSKQSNQDRGGVKKISLYISHGVERTKVDNEHSDFAEENLTFWFFIKVSLGFTKEIQELQKFGERTARNQENVIDTARASYIHNDPYAPTGGSIGSAGSQSHKQEALAMETIAEKQNMRTESTETTDTSSARDSFQSPAQILEQSDTRASNLRETQISRFSEQYDSNAKEIVSGSSTKSISCSTRRDGHISIHNDTDVHENDTNRTSMLQTVNVAFDFEDAQPEDNQSCYDRLPRAFKIGIDILTMNTYDQDVEFVEFLPQEFRKIRLQAGLTDDYYQHLFTTTVKERATEGGASGALFFHSKDEICVAKAMSEEDFNALLSHAKEYVEHMVENPDSYIAKIYGCYQLSIYRQKFFLFVMNNIFLNNLNHNNLDAYDIKGSWEARNAEMPKKNQRVPCKHCEQTFVYTMQKKKRRMANMLNGNPGPKSWVGWTSTATFSPFATMSRTDTSSSGDGLDNKNDLEVGSEVDSHKTDPRGHSELSGGTPNSHLTFNEHDYCLFTPNADRKHEPKVTYKDNDLREKIFLEPEAAEKLLNTLDKDAEFLKSQGVMDYSLLMGVHRINYDVNIPDIEDTMSTRMSISMMSNRDAPMESEGERSSMIAARNATYRMPLSVGQVHGPHCYYLGIIDFQQKFTYMKRLETWFKATIYNRDPDGISSIEPAKYKERFMDRMTDIIEVPTDLPPEMRSQSIDTHSAHPGKSITTIDPDRATGSDVRTPSGVAKKQSGTKLIPSTRRGSIHSPKADPRSEDF